MTVYEQVGGEAGVRAVLSDLYAQLFVDPIVGFLFVGHDIEHIVRVQTIFTRRMLGDSTAVYTGKSIPEAHAELPILPGHFDRRHHLLAQVLAAHCVPGEAREAWLKLDRGLRRSVLRVGDARIEELNRSREGEGSGGRES